jgi:hypothetical protein
MYDRWMRSTLVCDNCLSHPHPIEIRLLSLGIHTCRHSCESEPKMLKAQAKPNDKYTKQTTQFHQCQYKTEVENFAILVKFYVP